MKFKSLKIILPIFILFSLVISISLIGRDSIKKSNIFHTIINSLPGSKPTCCEHEWTVRFLHYHPSAVVPRRMYFASCNKKSDTPKMFTSFSLGKNEKHPKPDPSSGAILESKFNPETGKLEQTGDIAHFPECVWMEGISVSEDCNTITALCRRKYGDTDFDVDSLSTHPNKDWMTQPKCAQLSMWMYEWKNGNIHSKPKKILVHKAVDFGWEYGNNYTRNGENDNSYGVAIKARVADPKGQCHEADAFLVMDQKNYKMMDRGYYWACGTGHTTFNRLAYNPFSKKYAMMCSTDYSTIRKSNKFTGFWIRTENEKSKEFGYTNNENIHTKGGTGTILPTSDGGFIGILVGVKGKPKESNKIPLNPPTSIGIIKFDSKGNSKKGINWIKSQKNTYLSYPQLVQIGKDRFLFGYGEMKRIGDPKDTNDESYRTPWEYYVQEIDGNGKEITKPERLDKAGWGEQDEMVYLGKGKVGWAYIPNPTLIKGGEPRIPDCNSSSLQLSVYNSERINEEVIVEELPDLPLINDSKTTTEFLGKDDFSKEEVNCKDSKLIGLKWHFGTIVDRVRGICSDNKETGDVGADSGNGPKSFVCEGKGNYITSIEVWAFGLGDAIEKLKITCKNGVDSGIVGGWGNEAKHQTKPLTCPAGY
ncbi:MAG: hypothetical protein KDK36_05305, partial [Leptospiraceae bacterium]|nr:hypothetical protein [Leptospiraceae bacterium]